MLGTQVLNYRLTSLIGEGGMGHVYLGEHINLGRKAAIKILSRQYANNPEIRARFKNEAETLSKLHHPNIVALYDYVENDEMLCLVMEYVEGHNLDHYIANIRGPIPEAVALPLFEQTLRGFAYAHSMGVIHRDIKPSNIIITPTNTVKILDFGIAKLLEQVDHKLTRTGSRMGTVLYMSPELVQGKVVDLRSDIYSLGVTLFQMLSGREPYDKTLPEFEVYNNIVNNPLPRVKDFYPMVSSHVQDIIDKATRKDPNERFQNCEQFMASLHPTKITQNEAVLVEQVEPVKHAAAKVDAKPKKRQSRPRAIRILSLLLILGTLTGAVLLYYWYTSNVNVSYYVLADKLLLRPTKSDNSGQNAIATLRYGTPVRIVETDKLSDSDGLIWCKVRPEGSQNEGYVALNYLAPEGEYKKLRNIFKNDKAQQYTKVSFKKALAEFFEKNNLYTKSKSGDEVIYSTDWGFDESTAKVENYLAASPDLNDDKKDDYVCMLKNVVTNEKWLIAFTYTGPDEARQVVEKKLPAGSYRVKKAGKENLYFLGNYKTDSLSVKQSVKENLPADGFMLYDYNTNRTWLYLYSEKQGTVKEIEQ